MNFKASALCFLSTFLLLQASPVFAGRKSTMEEVKALQTGLIKKKNSIEVLLNTRAHIISKEIGDSGQGSLASMIRQVSIKGIKSQHERNIFEGPDAMDVLLKNELISKNVNSTEKVYTLTVLNPQHLEVLKKANAALKKSVNGENTFSNVLTNYIELSVKAKRYLTYKEAENLTNQIATMNFELQQLEELVVQLPLKEQTVLTSFNKNIEDWLNKKLVFVTIAKKGFLIEMVDDYHVYVPGLTIGTNALNKNYTPAHVASVIKKILTSAVLKGYDAGMGDFKIVVAKDKSNVGFFEGSVTKYKISPNEASDLKVEVSADLKITTISTKKFSVSLYTNYIKTNSFIIYSEGKKVFDHADLSYEDYYYQNIELKALLSQIVGSEVSMKNIYREFGFDSFGKDVGKAEFLVK